MLGGVFTDMTDEDDEQMRIVFEDGTSEECKRSSAHTALMA